MVVSERKRKDAVRAKKLGGPLRCALRDAWKKTDDQEMLNGLRNELGIAVKAFSVSEICTWVF